MKGHTLDDPFHRDDAAIVYGEIAEAGNDTPGGKEMSNAPEGGDSSGKIESDFVHRAPRLG